jgi:hypothetical protein
MRMPETEPAPPPGGKLDVTRIAIVAIAAVAVLVGGLAAVRLGRGVEASLGNFKFTVSRDDSFSDILNKAMDKDEGTVTALLEGKGFYRVTDPDLVGEIERLDPDDPAAAPVIVGLRRMLWNLSGPFRRPDTLTHAKVEMVAAIEDQTATPDDPERGKLVAELVKRSLDRSGMFEVRRFAARLQPLAPLTGELERSAPAIFTCPGSEMIGKQVQIWGAGQTIFGEVEPDVRLADACDGEAKTIQQLLQGKAGVFGISPEAYSVLTGPPPAGANPNPSFVLNPVDLAPQLFTRG